MRVEPNRPAVIGAALVLALLLTGCGGGAVDTGAPGLVDPAAFKPGIEHAYLPMTFGTTWILEGEHDGLPRREDVRALEEPRVILGVPCMAVRQEIFDDGVLTEFTTEWYAQDRDGNVWKFGEESIAFAGETFWRSEDSWVAGEGDGVPWLAMAAHPRVGDRYVGYRPDGQDVYMVTSVSETVTTPAGTFEGCMEVHENPEDPEDADIILHAPATGRVSEVNAAGRIVLVETRPD